MDWILMHVGDAVDAGRIAQQQYSNFGFSFLVAILFLDVVIELQTPWHVRLA